MKGFFRNVGGLLFAAGAMGTVAMMLVTAAAGRGTPFTEHGVVATSATALVGMAMYLKYAWDDAHRSRSTTGPIFKGEHSAKHRK